MSGTMRKMGVYLGLLEGAEDDFGYDDEPTGQVQRERRHGVEDSRAVARPQAPSRPRRPAESGGSGPSEGGHREVARLADHRRPPAPSVASGAGAPVSVGLTGSPGRIVTLHPRTYNEAKVIGENFRDGVPVIMDLSEMPDTDAKRLVDFAAGLIFAVHGSIERVTQKVFLLSPPHVSVAAEDKRRIAEGGFFNQS